MASFKVGSGGCSPARLDAAHDHHSFSSHQSPVLPGAGDG